MNVISDQLRTRYSWASVIATMFVVTANFTTYWNFPTFWQTLAFYILGPFMILVINGFGVKVSVRTSQLVAQPQI